MYDRAEKGMNLDVELTVNLWLVDFFKHLMHVLLIINQSIRTFMFGKLPCFILIDFIRLLVMVLVSDA